MSTYSYNYSSLGISGDLSIVKDPGYFDKFTYNSKDNSITIIYNNTKCTVYSSTVNCSPYSYSKAVAKAAGGVVAGILIPIILIAFGFTMTFMFCLKRRKVNGDMSWVCRKATPLCLCFRHRARGYQQHLERQLEKAKL
jgi:hypothetical protein